MEPRQRGNAVQLLEKYNNLARDAQQQGDRVQAETYMQYADHYHRVVAEMRARSEERQTQQQPQGERRGGRDRDDRGHDERYARDERADEDGVEDQDFEDGAEDGADDRGARRVEEPEDDVDGGALRTLARRASPPVDESAEAGNGEPSTDRPKRGRGRPRRQPRPGAEGGDAERESVDA